MPTLPTSLLNESVTIQSLSGSSVDDRGLSTSTWANSATDVPCRLVFNSESEQRDGRNTVVQNWTGYFTGSVDLKASDRLHWNSESKYFEITSARKTYNRVGRLFSVQADLILFE